MITLDQLIHDVADASQDLTEATATATAVGLITFQSEVDLLEEDDFYRGSEAYFLDGDNEGLVRRVISSDYVTQTITVIPDLAAAIETGDRVELYNRRDGGLKRAKYTDLINRAIRIGSGNYMEPVQIEDEGTYDGSQEIQIPVGIDAICSLHYYDEGSVTWKEIRRASRPGRRGWWPLREIESIGLSEEWANSLNGLSLRYTGMKEPDLLVLGVDETRMDPEWLTYTAAALAHMSNPYNYQNLGPGQYLMNRADAVRGRIAITPMANCARVK